MEAAGAAAHPPGGAARDRGPPLRPRGCCAPPAAAALRAGLDPGDRCGPSAAATTGQARACPRPRTAPAATCRPRMVGTERVIYRQCCNDPLSPGRAYPDGRAEPPIAVPDRDVQRARRWCAQRVPVTCATRSGWNAMRETGYLMIVECPAALARGPHPAARTHRS